MRGYKTADEFFENETAWHTELAKLRKIMLAAGLEETVKWGGPCYTHGGKNICAIGGFKEWVAIWFHQGALLTDPLGVLVNASEGRTKALRQWRFTHPAQIKPREIRSYVKEAVERSSSGEAIKPDRNKPLEIPAELAAALRRNKQAARAFEGMSKACKREYAEYISEAKRPETRARRLEKSLEMIAAGSGLNDKYR